MNRNVRAAELKKGDEFFYQGELHRVTVNDPDPYNGDEERKIYTYVVERPLTAPFIIWWPNDQVVTLESMSDNQIPSGVTHGGRRYGNEIVVKVYGRKRGKYARDVAQAMVEPDEALTPRESNHPYYHFTTEKRDAPPK